MTSLVTVKLTWDHMMCYVSSIFSYFQLNKDKKLLGLVRQSVRSLKKFGFQIET